MGKDLICKSSAYQQEYKEHGLIIVRPKLLLDIRLGVVHNDRLQINFPRGIDAMHITKGSSHNESCVWDGSLLFVSVPNPPRLSVDSRRVNIAVIHTIFFTAIDIIVIVILNRTLWDVLKTDSEHDAFWNTCSLSELVSCILYKKRSCAPVGFRINRDDDFLIGAQKL